MTNETYDQSLNVALQTSGQSFTSRELECLQWIIDGLTAKQIARQMHISYRTVEAYVQSLKNKMKCHSKIQLISKVLKLLIG